MEFWKIVNWLFRMGRWDNRACVYACVYVVIMHVCVLCMCICVLCVCVHVCCMYVCG